MTEPATDSQTRGPLGLIPRFSPPPRRRPDPPMTPDPLTAGPDPMTGHRLMPDDGPGLAELDDSPIRRPDPSATPTPISGSTGDLATATEIGKLVAGALGLIATAAAFGVRLYYAQRRSLRQPTGDQLDEIGKPIGRILRRRATITKLAPDLFDGLQAAVGLTRYLEDGPLLVDEYPTVNIPTIEETD